LLTQKQEVALHFARTNRRKKSLKIIGPYLANDLPLNVRQSPSLASFNYHLNHYHHRSLLRQMAAQKQTAVKNKKNII